MKHRQVRQKYSATRRIFNFLVGVSSGDETLRLIFDILHETLGRMFDISSQPKSFLKEKLRMQK